MTLALASETKYYQLLTNNVIPGKERENLNIGFGVDGRRQVKIGAYIPLAAVSYTGVKHVSHQSSSSLKNDHMDSTLMSVGVQMPCI